MITAPPGAWFTQITSSKLPLELILPINCFVDSFCSHFLPWYLKISHTRFKILLERGVEIVCRPCLNEEWKKREDPMHCHESHWSHFIDQSDGSIARATWLNLVEVMSQAHWGDSSDPSTTRVALAKQHHHSLNAMPRKSTLIVRTSWQTWGAAW